ncbi:conserved hypothetical protein [Neospora caninum Liverpool]|uniref:Uncharacterized protein n=1 Tax=Neospora caninum (strain Liverpool) TaxID=572307 RepID=F0VJ92_NEOCL|nr:conserved hypothetical protein [Neospora caninum Liverpool]CBZ53803.1 conserved hypothetical protein [Neospora caninum Liverpool]CEL67797.1 TPA: hypothetical protein BN1204_035840 [Neospora caninum Liverpool]|eukprot:XP_003883835.1 conserved hypothetical protein [Neospora caninum Liverpool]
MEASAPPSAGEASELRSSEHESPCTFSPEDATKSPESSSWGEVSGGEDCGDAGDGPSCLAFPGLTKGRSASWDFEAQGGSPPTLLGVRDIHRLAGAARLHLSLIKKTGEAEGGDWPASAKPGAWALHKIHSTASADGRRAPPGTAEASAQLFVDLLQTLEAAGETMRKMEEQVAHHGRRAEQLNARLERAVAHNDSMYAESEQLERRLREAKAEVEALRSRCARLESKPDYRERYVASERGRADLERQVKSLQAQVDAFRAGTQKEQRHREEMEEEVSGIKKRLEEREEQLLLTRRSLRSAVEQSSQLTDDLVPPQSSGRRRRRSYFISGNQLHLGPAPCTASPRQLFGTPRSEAFLSPRLSGSTCEDARRLKFGCFAVPPLNMEGLSKSASVVADQSQTATNRRNSSARWGETGERGQGECLGEGPEARRGDEVRGLVGKEVAGLNLASLDSFSTAPPTGREAAVSSDRVPSGRAGICGGWTTAGGERKEKEAGSAEVWRHCGRGENDQTSREGASARRDDAVREQSSRASLCEAGKIEREADPMERHATSLSFSLLEDGAENRGTDWEDSTFLGRAPRVRGAGCMCWTTETRGRNETGGRQPSQASSPTAATLANTRSGSQCCSRPVSSFPSARVRRCPTLANSDSTAVNTRTESTWRRLAKHSSLQASDPPFALSSPPYRVATAEPCLSFSSSSVASFSAMEGTEEGKARRVGDASVRRVTSLCLEGRAAVKGGRMGVAGLNHGASFPSKFSSRFSADGNTEQRARQPGLSMFEELLQMGQALTEEEERMKRTLDGLLAAVAASSVPFEDLAAKDLSKECLLKIRKLRQNGPKNAQTSRVSGGFFSPVLYPLLSSLFNAQRLRGSDAPPHRPLLARVKALPRSVLQFLLGTVCRETVDAEKQNGEIANGSEGRAAPKTLTDTSSETNAADAASFLSAFSLPAFSPAPRPPSSSPGIWHAVKALLGQAHPSGAGAVPEGDVTNARGPEAAGESHERRAGQNPTTRDASDPTSASQRPRQDGEGTEQVDSDHRQALPVDEDHLPPSGPAKMAGLAVLAAVLFSAFVAAVVLPPSPLSRSGLS